MVEYVAKRTRMMLSSDAKGVAVTILAVWFGVALVVGLLLGYAAHRLKRVPKRQPPMRRANTANANDSGQEELTSSMRTNKRFPKR
jgi:hypothetical protein